MRGAGHKAKRRHHHTHGDHGTMAAAARRRALGAQHALEQREQACAAGERDGGCGEDGAEGQREGHGRGAVRVSLLGTGRERLKAEGQGRAAAAGWVQPLKRQMRAAGGPGLLDPRDVSRGVHGVREGAAKPKIY